METFDFSEALSFMKCDFMVIGPNGKGYRIVDNQIICYPMPITRPKFRRVEVRFNAETILYNKWTLFENPNETSSK